jgi:hypothetical protein
MMQRSLVKSGVVESDPGGTLLRLAGDHGLIGEIRFAFQHRHGRMSPFQSRLEEPTKLRGVGNDGDIPRRTGLDMPGEGDRSPDNSQETQDRDDEEYLHVSAQRIPRRRKFVQFIRRRMGDGPDFCGVAILQVQQRCGYELDTFPPLGSFPLDRFGSSRCTEINGTGANNSAGRDRYSDRRTLVRTWPAELAKSRNRCSSGSCSKPRIPRHVRSEWPHRLRTEAPGSERA